MTKIANARYQEIAGLHASGMTQAAIGAQLGVSRPRVSQILQEVRIAARVVVAPLNQVRMPIVDRKQAMAELYKSGATLEEVGTEFGISRERVRQIVKRLGVERTEGGRAMRAFRDTSIKVATNRAKNDLQEERTRSIWNMSLGDYKAHVAEYGSSAVASSPMGKYKQHRANAMKRGITWSFTFPEWWQVWQESGKWSERGRGAGYVMARYGDGDTPYSAETVYFCTQSQNSKDGYIVTPGAVRAAKAAATRQLKRTTTGAKHDDHYQADKRRSPCRPRASHEGPDCADARAVATRVGLESDPA